MDTSASVPYGYYELCLVPADAAEAKEDETPGQVGEYRLKNAHGELVEGDVTATTWCSDGYTLSFTDYFNFETGHGFHFVLSEPGKRVLVNETVQDAKDRHTATPLWKDQLLQLHWRDCREVPKPARKPAVKPVIVEEPEGKTTFLPDCWTKNKYRVKVIVPVVCVLGVLVVLYLVFAGEKKEDNENDVEAPPANDDNE